MWENLGNYVESEWFKFKDIRWVDLNSKLQFAMLRMARLEIIQDIFSEVVKFP